jgi:Polyketide cyclase / dehydrase and lipid transport
MSGARSQTQSIEVDAAPDEVVAVLADAARLPEWAPGFADAVVGDDKSGWVATKDGRDFSIRVPVNAQAGTVDFLRETSPGKEAGAYLRAVPRMGGGTVLMMTLPVLRDGDPAAVAAILAEELAALAALVTPSS